MALSLVSSLARPCSGALRTKTFMVNLRPVSTASQSAGKHTALWTAERGLSIGLLGIIPTALAYPSSGLDALMAVSIVMHQHWGLEAIVTDYVRPVMFGNIVPKVAHGALLVYSITALGGLLYFSYNDVGISRSIRKLWAIKGQ